MSYDYKIYENSEELKENDLQLYKELLNAGFISEDYSGNFYVYDSLTDYAIYEVEEGWYASLLYGIVDFNGAPDLFDYIDYEALGPDLACNWDDSVTFHASDDRVITID